MDDNSRGQAEAINELYYSYHFLFYDFVGM